MTINSFADWSTTAANNADVGGNQIGEGSQSRGWNNAIREMMAQLKTRGNTVDARLLMPVLVSDYASGATAADVAYSLGRPLYVGPGESAYLDCDPTGGDDFAAMAKWLTTCWKHPGGTMYLRLANGGHAVSEGLLLERPGFTLDIRGTDIPDFRTVTGITSSSVSGSTYEATVTVSSPLPDQVIVGSPIGMENIQGDNNAKVFNGGQVVKSIAGDRLSFTFDFFSPKAAPTAPSAMDNTAINGMTPNQVLCPKGWLVCDEDGWVGTSQEGFIACRGGAKVSLQDIGFVFDGAAAGDDHMIAVRDTGSFVHLVQYCIFAGAGDKVIRCTFGAGFFLNRSQIGGATKARVGVDIAIGCAGTIARCSLGGFSNQIVNVGTNCGITIVQSVGGGASTAVQIPNSGAGAGVLYSLSQFDFCGTGLYAQNGCITITEDADSIISGMTHGQRWVDGEGYFVGEATFSSNTSNHTADSTTWTPTLTNTTNVASSTAVLCRHSKQGRFHRGFGRLSVTPSADAGTLTVVGISLPVASNFADTKDLVGSASIHQLSATGNVPMSLIADTANDRMLLSWYAQSTSAHTIHFTFEYLEI